VSASATGVNTQRDSSNRLYRLIAIQFSVFLALATTVLLEFEADRSRKAVYSEAERQGQFIFSTLGRQVTDALYFNDIEEVREAAEIVDNQNSVSRIAVFSDSGRFLFDSEQAMVPTGGVASELFELAQQNDNYAYRFRPDGIEFVGALRFDEAKLGMNAQLVQSQKLEALGVMARGIAHDFNNLLTAVMASADLLTREPPGSTFDRYIQNIISGARRASDLCRQLLAYGGSEEKAVVRTDLTSELE